MHRWIILLAIIACGIIFASRSVIIQKKNPIKHKTAQKKNQGNLSSFPVSTTKKTEIAIQADDSDKSSEIFQLFEELISKHQEEVSDEQKKLIQKIAAIVKGKDLSELKKRLNKGGLNSLYAGKILSVIGNKEAVDVLIQIVTEIEKIDESIEPDVWMERRVAAEMALFELTSEEAKLALNDLALNHSNPITRMISSNALAKMSSETANSLYIRQLGSDPDSMVRANAASQLSNSSDISSQQALISALKNDQDESVRESAAMSLGLIGTGEAKAALQSALSTEPSESVRLTIESALNR